MLLQSLLVLIICVLSFAPGQPRLPEDEVESLKVIAKTMGKMDWNFSVDPCSGLSGWDFSKDPEVTKYNMNAVTCNCSFANNTVCHVVSIILKGQNLSGSVPQELTRLPFLQEIDLTRNYLNGTIPREWGSMKLVHISLLGNRITGPIPKELGNISTLTNLTLEYNQLSGTIPPELGNLSSIEKFVIMSNNLTGEIPPELAKLTTLKDFGISDNNFTGKIPDFIESWTNIKKLVIQGSGLTGPIPPGIATLTNLIDLRISDLSGHESKFPNLSNVKNLKTLILRSCNIVGPLPTYIGDMKKLETLDLSFNKLDGSISKNFSGLSRVEHIYLTGNSLSGRIPQWMHTRGEIIDLSYNNLTLGGSESNCQPRSVNLFASSKGNALNSGIVSCLKNTKCHKKYSSLYINCGGGQVHGYEDDNESGQSSHFHQGKSNWGYSNTGHFMDDARQVDMFIWPPSTDDARHVDMFIWPPSTVPNTGENLLYKDARLSPLSLTYYAYCMINGTYTVYLHFAEIMFTNDSTYTSLGRRIFDIYIQEMLVLKDFNIAEAAGGVNKGIKINFTAVVIDGTLDIRFYWAGKGTNGIPFRSVYGPLISAISVEPNFKPSSENLYKSAIVGIIGGALFAIFSVLVILWWKGCLGRKDMMLHDLKGLDLQMGVFPLRQIKAATDNFDPANIIGEGGFGPVYKGHLSNGTIIAVKQLSSKSKQGNREFLNEIGMISALQHPHLVKLYGCAIEGNQLLLVYEYMENNSLARALFGPEELQLHLDWPTRHKICIGLARGLAYLHEESRLKIVHRDIKATNVLLDKNLIPKISDFGLAKLDEEDNTYISSRVAGTYGYMAPEYAMRGHLSDNVDVFSFGVVLLEIVSGRSNTSIKPKEDSFYLLDWANSLKEEGNLLELVDPRLESNYDMKEVILTINVALLCTNAVAFERPSMSTVVSILKGKDYGYEFKSGDKVSAPDVLMNHGDGENTSLDVPRTTPSLFSDDLYPTSLNSEYSAKGDPQR